MSAWCVHTIDVTTALPLREVDSSVQARATDAVFSTRREMGRLVTAIVEREGDGYVALCPEVDVASQGQNIVEARNNLKEALELFF